MSDENVETEKDEFEGHKLAEIGKVDEPVDPERVSTKVDEDDFEGHKLAETGKVVEKVTDT